MPIEGLELVAPPVPLSSKRQARISQPSAKRKCKFLVILHCAFQYSYVCLVVCLHGRMSRASAQAHVSKKELCALLQLLFIYFLSNLLRHLSFLLPIVRSKDCIIQCTNRTMILHFLTQSQGEIGYYAKAIKH
jgi:hypothetical protein